MDKYEELNSLIFQQNSMIGFEKYVYNSRENYTELFELIKSCKIENIKSRFNVWRFCMRVMSVEGTPQQQIEQIQNSRQQYKRKKQDCNNPINQINKIKKQTQVSKNPLMKAMNKPQKSPVIQDQFLRTQIKKDVDRTYQQMAFFQNPIALRLLSIILYVWCKKNPEVSYKQGMNEILASLIYVYFQSAEFVTKKPQAYKQVSNEVQNHYHKLNSIQFAQADIYTVFEKVMNIQCEMYKQQDSSIKGVINPNSKNNSPILQRIIEIQDHKLKMLDLDLFRMIKMQDVKTKSFLLRWIRCMHTRQFTLQNSFTIWDSIFLDYYQSPTCKTRCVFEFVDAMCLGMFIYMRSIVLSRQTANQILQTYQKYPSLDGQYLQQLITLAWSICEALRNQQNMSNNWIQQNKKVDKLHFMQAKNAHTPLNTKQTEQKRKKMQQNQFKIMSQTKQYQREQNKLFAKKQSPETVKQKQQKFDQVDLFSKKNVNLQKNKSSNSPQHQKTKNNVSQNDNSSIIKLIMNGNQFKEVEQLLQKSMQMNENDQSKQLTMKALKLLQNKLKVQQKSPYKKPLF